MTQREAEKVGRAIDAFRLSYPNADGELKIVEPDDGSVIVGIPASGGGLWIRRPENGPHETGVLWGGDVWEPHGRNKVRITGTGPRQAPPPRGLDKASTNRMTDDELFELSTRIHRIESSMVTWQRMMAVRPDESMFESHAKVLELRRKLDEQLGFAEDMAPMACQSCDANASEKVILVARSSAVCTECMSKIPSKVAKMVASLAAGLNEVMR